MNRIITLSSFATAAAFFCISAYAQLPETKARLHPDREYAVTVKKSFGGHDGFNEVIPQVSEQSVSIITGRAGDAGMPVTLLVDRPRRIDEKSGRLGETRREWEIRFIVAPDGSVSDISGASSDDGPVPDAITSSVLTSQLDALLFLTDYKLDRKGKPQAHVGSARENTPGLIELSYVLRDEAGLEQLSVGGEGASMTAAGVAAFSVSDQFFTMRRHEATTTMHVMQVATGDEKVVTMTEKTTWEVRVKGEE